MSESLQLWQ